MAAKRKHPEQDFQIALVRDLRLILVPPWRVIGFKNQGERPTKRMHGILKAMGVLSGFPDIGVFGPGRRALFIELKRPAEILPSGRKSNRRLDTSAAQDDCHEWLERCGFPVLVANDAETVMRWLAINEAPVRVRGLG